VLDYCSIVIQVTTVRKEVDKFPTKYEPLSPKDKENMDACKSNTGIFCDRF
jgi:hypothetical protein